MLENYIGCKLIKAEPMTVSEFATSENRPVAYDHDDPRGYKVVYRDGYVSWSPKAEFEKAYMRVIPNPRLKTDVSISLEMVDNFIKDVKTSTLGDKTTLVQVTLVNGFEIIEASACVDPDNYSEEIGREVCLNKIKNKVWELLGFLLQTAVGGVKSPKVDENGVEHITKYEL